MDAAATAPLPRSELAVRMFAGATLVMVVTVAAAALGPRWTGLLAMFPVLGSILGVFSHRRNGCFFVARLFRGMYFGFCSFATFCVVLSLALTTVSEPLAFAAAISAALVVQAIVYFTVALDGSPKPPRPK
jgi:hypothetical protein